MAPVDIDQLRTWGPKPPSDGTPSPPEGASIASLPPKPGDSGYQSPSQPPFGFAPPALGERQPPTMWRARGFGDGFDDIFGPRDTGRELTPYDIFWIEIAVTVGDSLDIASGVNPLQALKALVGLVQRASKITSMEAQKTGTSNDLADLIAKVLPIAQSSELHSFLRSAAFRFLMAVDPQSTLPQLLDTLEDRKAPKALRLAVAEMLSETKVPLSYDDIVRIAWLDTTPSPSLELRAQLMTTMAHVSIDTTHGWIVNKLVSGALGADELVATAAEEGLESLLSRVDPASQDIRVNYDALRRTYIQGRGAALRDRALVLSGAWGPLAVPDLLQMARDDLESAVKALEFMGADGVETLAQLTIDPEYIHTIRTEARDALVRLGEEGGDAAFAIARLLAHPDPGLRSAAEYVRASGKLSTVALIVLFHSKNDELQKLVQSRLDGEMRQGNFRLRRIFVERVLTHLEQALATPPSQDRLAKYRPTALQCMSALTTLGVAAWDDIEKRYLCTNADDPMRHQLEAIMQVIAARAAPDLVQKLRGRTGAAEAAVDLERIGTYAIPLLIDLVENGSPAAAKRAGEVLAELGVPGFEAMAALQRKPGVSATVIARLDRAMEAAGTVLARVWAEDPPATRRADGRFDLLPEGLRRGK